MVHRMKLNAKTNKAQLKQVVIGMLEMDGDWYSTNCQIAMIL